MYDEPPGLPPRSDDLYQDDAPPLPSRALVEEEEQDEYNELADPPPMPAGLRLPSV